MGQPKHNIAHKIVFLIKEHSLFGCGNLKFLENSNKNALLIFREIYIINIRYLHRYHFGVVVSEISPPYQIVSQISECSN